MTKARKKTSHKLRAPVRKLLEDVQWELTDQYGQGDPYEWRHNAHYRALEKLIRRCQRALKVDDDA